MKGKLFLFIIVVLVILPSFCLSKDIPFTQDDRDRLIRVEEGLKGVNQRVNSLEKRIDSLERSVNQRIDSLQNLLYIVIGAIIAQIVGVVGFVLWDRRTALAPAIRKNKELEERQDRMEKAFKELARRDSSDAEVLRNVGLL